MVRSKEGMENFQTKKRKINIQDHNKDIKDFDNLMKTETRHLRSPMQNDLVFDACLFSSTLGNSWSLKIDFPPVPSHPYFLHSAFFTNSFLSFNFPPILFFPSFLPFKSTNFTVFRQEPAFVSGIPWFCQCISKGWPFDSGMKFRPGLRSKCVGSHT